MIGIIHIVIGSFHVCYVYRGALRRLMHIEVCIGLDIAHFPSLMYGFIMQQRAENNNKNESVKQPGLTDDEVQRLVLHVGVHAWAGLWKEDLFN